ncbi:MAG: hypothetical protein HN849_13190 [Victivallales bacterium]|nr:hypothetical protein [Victivallales bacterium]
MSDPTRQELRQGRAAAACALLALALLTGTSLLGAERPTLPPVPTGVTPPVAVGDASGNTQWNVGALRHGPADEKVTARASYTVRKTTGKGDRQELAYPEGTVKVSAAIGVSGWPSLTHTEYRIPPGQSAKKRWDYGILKLADGTTVHGDSIGCQSGNENFSPWSFITLRAEAPGTTKAVEILKPALCLGAAAFDGDGWASAEMVFARPVAEDCEVRTSIRIKRVAGDPFLYVQVAVDPQGATLEALRISGYPNYAHALIYGLRPRYPKAARFVDRERWVWAAGHDWNMHDKQPHGAALEGNDPGGIFWYNRRNSEVGGMMAVFLPEEVSQVEAAGTYGVSAALHMKGQVLHFALLEWRDWRGWEALRRDFVGSLPSATRRLRDMRFAWPVKDLLGPARRRQLVMLTASSLVDSQARQALGARLQDYEHARAALIATPLQETETRYAAERQLIILKDDLVQAAKPLLREWLKQGGIFERTEPKPQ